MPVHDEQMPDTQMPGLVWTKVAPGKWREVAPVVAEVAPVARVTDDAADQSAKRARTLTFNDKNADFKNWLDVLQHMDHDAYVTLMRYFVNVEAFEPQARLDGPIRARWNQNRPWRWRYHLRPGLSKYKEPEVNIYGLKYRTRDRQYFDYDDDSYYTIMSVAALASDQMPGQYHPSRAAGRRSLPRLPLPAQLLGWSGLHLVYTIGLS